MAKQSLKGTETILIVIKDKTITSLIREMLERFGYSIFSADSISSALNVYSQKNSEIDLVWFDLEIPWIENKISLDTFETCSDISTEKNKEVELSFLDLEMFGIGGKKTFEKFKSYNPGVKVLATCGYLVDGIIDTINEEVEELLVKPFTVIKTLNRIRDYLDKTSYFFK